MKLKIHIEELQSWYNEHAPLEISVFTITNLKCTASCNTHTIVFIMYCTYFYKVLYYYNYSLYSNKHMVILFKCCWDTDRYRSAHLGPKINVFFFPHLLLIDWPHADSLCLAIYYYYPYQISSVNIQGINVIVKHII